ncbi:MAG: disulfide bond formation protein B [Rhodocyclaceae bacterium]|jgi:disulfide bond formation protein DsbB|nr:disulfide bond formation protein B [Rhodocyclaceae bacterium]
MIGESSSRQWNQFFVCWLIAVSATLGSLFFSEVMERVPCVLCWYQRIAMFPLAIIFTVGLLPLDVRCVRYALPFAVSGWALALYHCLIYLGFIPESLQPCTQGVSCADVQIELVGFVTIPLLSLLGFTFIIALLLAVRKGIKQ